MPSATRQSPGGCECGCSVTFQTRNPCASDALVGGVDLTVYDATTHAVVATATTDVSGSVVVALPGPGDYDVVSSKTSMYGGAARLTVACGGTYVVPIASASKRIRSNGCNSMAVPGVSATITGPGGYRWTGVTDSGGDLWWYPPAAATYTIVMSHPSGRFAARTVNQAVVNPCAFQLITIQLFAAAGYVCCAPTPYPLKLPLLCVADDGTSWTQPTCSVETCVDVTVTQAGPSSPDVDPVCGDFIPPAIGPAVHRLSIRVNPAAGTAHYIYRSNTTTHRLAGSACGTAADYWTAWYWWDGTCPSGSFPSRMDSTSASVSSASPYVATFYFDNSNRAYTGVTGDGKTRLKALFNSITASESP